MLAVKDENWPCFSNSKLKLKTKLNIKKQISVTTNFLKFLMQKMWKSLFGPAVEVPNPKTLVKICNHNVLVCSNTILMLLRLATRLKCFNIPSISCVSIKRLKRLVRWSCSCKLKTPADWPFHYKHAHAKAKMYPITYNWFTMPLNWTHNNLWCVQLGGIVIHN